MLVTKTRLTGTFANESLGSTTYQDPISIFSLVPHISTKLQLPDKLKMSALRQRGKVGKNRQLQREGTSAVFSLWFI